MGWTDVLAHRALVAKTPYKADEWQRELQQTGLFTKYPTVVEGLRTRFSFNYLPITSTQAPPNRDSVVEFAVPFQQAIQMELDKGRYLGPFSHMNLELLLGPFQSSPFSIIPKPDRPGKYCLLQNLSFPHTPSSTFPSPSINSLVNSDDFPSTWGTFNTICLLV